MEEAEVPLEHLHGQVHHSAEHSGETWISWVALSTAILAVLAAIFSRLVLVTDMRVLAIDASLRNTGVAVVDANNGKARALYFGTIHNAQKLRSSSCLVAIRDRLIELIREHEPDCCALESVIYVQSYKTAILLGAARGAAILAAAENGLPVFEYPPTRIKQATVGRGGAGKNQVAFMVRALLSLTETPDADAADALAIGLTHVRAQETARMGIPGATQI